MKDTATFKEAMGVALKKDKIRDALNTCIDEAMEDEGLTAPEKITAIYEAIKALDELCLSTVN